MIVASSGLATTCFSLGANWSSCLKGSRYMLKLCHDHVPATRIFVFKATDLVWMAVGTYSQVLVWRDAVASVSFSPIENGSFVWPIYVFDAESIATWRWHTELWAIRRSRDLLVSVGDRSSSGCIVPRHAAYFLSASCWNWQLWRVFGHLGAQPITSHLFLGEHNNPVNHNFSAD